MASMVARASNGSCTSQVPPLHPVQENGSRNKRKFRADPPLGDPSNVMPSPQKESSGHEFSAEKLEAALVNGASSVCQCGINQDHTDGLKLDLRLSSGGGLSEVGTCQSKEELESEESHDADWSDLTESQLEELVLSNLDAIFKSAIKNIVACGYTEEVATKAILRSGLCYGCKDTVSNVVDNTLAFLRAGQEVDPSREHCFEDLQQMEKYILAEWVCVLREVRPFFSTGEAMWCLLICDMNVSHACAMDGEHSSGFSADGDSNGTSAVSTQNQVKTEAKYSELNLPNPYKLESSVPCSPIYQLEAPNNVTGVPNITKTKNSGVLSGLVSEKDGLNSMCDPADKSFNFARTSQPPVLEEKVIVSRKVHSNCTKRENTLRQKSLHLDKGYRTYGPKGSRTEKLSSLILDNKLKSVSDSALKINDASLRSSKVMGVDVHQDSGGQNLSNNPGCSSLAASNLATATMASLSETNVPSAPSLVNTPPALPTLNTPPALAATDIELSLSFPSKSSYTPISANCNVESSNCNFAGMQYDKSVAHWVPRDKKDEMIMKLVPRVQELQNQLQEWTEWTNQKVMQAARRLSKDKAELKSLRQEKEDVERLKKEKQTLEENTMKKLTEMENALGKASGQVERANYAVRRLEVENAMLRQDMEAAKLRAAESAATCQEVLEREKTTLMKVQSWEKQKTLLQEELSAERRKAVQLLQDLEQAKQLQEQLEARWRQEEKAKEELVLQASSIRKEREQVEASAKSEEDTIKLKAETNLRKYKDNIQKLEKEISQTDSSKIAALRMGINESYASRVRDVKYSSAQKDVLSPHYTVMDTDAEEHTDIGGVKRERECVMCLSEEMSVVFLPCAHQVVCTTCNELHQKQGMKDCPSCRSTIQRRILVRHARS